MDHRGELDDQPDGLDHGLNLLESSSKMTAVVASAGSTESGKELQIKEEGMDA